VTREQRIELIVLRRTSLYVWQFMLKQNPEDKIAFAGILEDMEALSELKHSKSVARVLEKSLDQGATVE